MRIISGALKGKPINFLKNLNTRPLKDSVKENIFNILEHLKSINVKISNGKVLDLYSGFGSFGIECLSRGAKKVTFVEYNYETSKILEKNLLNLSLLKRSNVLNTSVENLLTYKLEKFNIFFFDPPFNDKKFSQNLELIKKKKIYKKDHIVIIHREKKANEDLRSKIEIIKTRFYGRSKIIFGVFN